MSATSKKFEYCQFTPKFLGDFIAGEFRIPKDVSGSWKGISPANLDDHLGEVLYCHQHVDEAVAAARLAFQSWRKVKVTERAQLIKKYQDIVKFREAEFMEAIARETGKPLWECKTEVAGMVSKVAITIEQSMKLVEDQEVSDASPGAKGFCRYKPLGVAAVIGPFNFPGHLPNGHIIPALLTGNTVIFKPSEKTPWVGQLMAECFQAAGLPAGVFNLLQGEKELSRRLCTHEGVDGILFTGSYEVGTRIKQDTLLQHWKLVALEMGGKNAAIIWQDAHLDVALREILFGAFVTCGQRCSATSRVIVHQNLLDQFLEKFHQRSKAFKIGHPLDPAAPFMGPLIDKASVDRYLKFQGIALREGNEAVMHGKAFEAEYEGRYVTPSIFKIKDSSVTGARKSVFQQTELFAPCVAVLTTQEIEHAIALGNETQYGLVGSVFTQSRDIYQKCLEDWNVGLINWNKSTAGASSKLPFGGTKKSGNHWPTGVSATRYCTYPVASLEVAEPTHELPNFPGLNWTS